MSSELHEETTKLFISAVRQKQSDSIDPDIQVGEFKIMILLYFH